VFDRVADDLEGAPVGLLLTDQRAQVVARRAGDSGTFRLLDRIHLAPGFLYGEEQIGTNAIGTAIQTRSPTLVEGREHFADALTRMACAAVPVSDPATGQLIGVVDLTCVAVDVNPLMLPLVKRAAWEIEQHLLEGSSADERILQEHFLRARRTTRGPVLALNRRTMLLNGAATGIVKLADRESLWDNVLRSLAVGAGAPPPVELADGRFIEMRLEPVLDGTRLIGALIRPRAAQRTAASPGLDGWSSLTDTELAIAEQIANGMTNREAAAHLYLSPHTIDYHLRQVFRKLEIRSRVDLTRIVARRSAAD